MGTKNNVDRFEFTVSDGTHKAAKLMQQNIVLKRVRDGSFVSYVINESEQDSVNRSKKSMRSVNIQNSERQKLLNRKQLNLIQ